MRVFDRDSKINFVDDNNVFVGYDMGQCCCEHADYFVSDDIREVDDELCDRGNSQLSEELGGFNFDKDFMEHISDGVVFRLINECGVYKFLHLFNIHNGYYSHGFNMFDGETVIHNDYI